MSPNTENKEKSSVDICDAKGLSQLSYLDDDIAILEATPALWRSAPIKMNVFALISCIRGNLLVHINGEEYHLRPNEILLCESNSQLMDGRPDKAFYGYVLCFSRKVVQENIQFSKGMLDKLLQLRKAPILTLSEQEVKLYRAYRNLISIRFEMIGRPYNKEVMYSMVRSILFEMLANIHKRLPIVTSDDSHIRARDVLFRRFIELVSSLGVKPRSISWYSSQLCVSPKYLSSVCKQVSQRTAFEWINEYVMIDIRQQLKYSEKSIKEIADHLGFPSISFFGKYVRQHTGYSPIEYRKLLRETA